MRLLERLGPGSNRDNVDEVASADPAQPNASTLDHARNVRDRVRHLFGDVVRRSVEERVHRLVRQPSRGDTLFHELVLFRMSPPDPEKEIPGQKRPILSFAVYLPDSAAQHNADRVVGTTYYWRFTEQMAAPDSVHVVWPAGPRM